MVVKTCPDDETLQNLLLGRLSVPEFESWESHLLSCENCARRASSLNGADDFTKAIKSPSKLELEPASVEALVKRGLQIFEETRAQSSDETAEFEGDTATGDHSSKTESSDAPPSLSFLDDAHDASELGRLGGYRILRLLGQGGMGMVFLAEEEALHRQVALKVMSPSLSGNESARLRFLREARAMAAVVNDHIVPIHQVGEHNQIPFLAMPLLEGESLGDCLKREGKLSLAQACSLGKEIASGLAAAHAGGLIHRDIKPDNIWLEAPSGRVKILDFGLARAQEDNELTQSGTVMGTPKYMSPEQAEGHEVDQRSDLFSLGSVLYHSIAGQTPFRGKSLAATLVSVISTEPSPLTQMREDTPAELSELVSKLMSKNVDARPTSAESVVADFARLEERLAQSDLAETKHKTRTNQRTSRPTASNSNRSFFPVYAIGAALALGFLVFLASVLIEWKTPAGTVYITIDSADTVTSIDVSKDALTITDPNDGKKIQVTVDEANSKMRLEKEGFAAVLTEFNLSSPDGRNIAVKFVPSAVVDRIGNSESSDVPTMGSGDLERQIAQWVLDQGGSLQLWVLESGSLSEVGETDALPQGDFSVARISLPKVEREADLAFLAGLKSEASVWMPGTDITGACFEHLGKIQKLEGLNLQYCRNIDPSYVSMLSSAQNLQMLLLLESSLGNEVAELAIKVRSLFHIEFGSQLTGDGLQVLKDCEHITAMSLLGCTLLTSDDFRHLADIPKLNQLSVDPTHINATAVEHFAKIPSLKILRINNSNDSGARDVSLLGNLDALAELDLSYGVVTVDQLEPLQDMQSLRLLGLRGTGLSQADLARVSAILPRCELVTDDGTLPRAESDQ